MLLICNHIFPLMSINYQRLCFIYINLCVRNLFHLQCLIPVSLNTKDWKLNKVRDYKIAKYVVHFVHFQISNLSCLKQRMSETTKVKKYSLFVSCSVFFWKLLNICQRMQSSYMLGGKPLDPVYLFSRSKQIHGNVAY